MGIKKPKGKFTINQIVQIQHPEHAEDKPFDGQVSLVMGGDYDEEKGMWWYKLKGANAFFWEESLQPYVDERPNQQQQQEQQQNGSIRA